MLPFILGCITGAVILGLYAILGFGGRPQTFDQLSDERADAERAIEFGEFIQHRQLATQRERNDHA